VGIGSGNPQAKLDVSGNIILSHTSGYQIKKSDNSIANIMSLDIGNTFRLRGGGGSFYINPDNTGGTTLINFNNNSTIGLYNAANPRVITTSVGVGINKTPSTNLDVSGNVTVTGNIIPGSDVIYDLGSSTKRWKDLYLSGTKIDLSGAVIRYDPVTEGIKLVNNADNTLIATFKDVIADGNVTIGNNLTVNGDLTTLETSTVVVDDPIITLGGYQTLTSNDNKDRGIEFRYYDGASKVGFFGYDNTTGNLIYVKDATNTNEVFSGTHGTIEGSTFKSTVTNGTPPLTVTSTTVVTNLNADLLDGLQGSHYSDYNNLTNKPWIASGSNIYYSTGNVGIGKTNPTSTLDVSGNIYSSGEITAFSDRKLKSNITKITDAISKIESINGYTYDRVDNMDKRHMGVIAQELVDVLPEVVFQQGDTLSVAYGNIVAVLIEGMKELNQRVKMLEADLVNLVKLRDQQ
jgi:hypothetical protein